MSGYREYRFYSPEFDCEAARLSMVDEHNSEFFTIIPVRGYRVYREARDRALDMIDEAIAAGAEPGEVR